MRDWRRKMSTSLAEGTGPAGDRLDLVITGWLFHRRTNLPPTVEFMQANLELGGEAVAARKAAWRWYGFLAGRFVRSFTEEPPFPLAGARRLVRARQVAPGVWRASSEGGETLLVSRERERLVPEPFRRAEGIYREPRERAVILACFPFLRWDGTGADPLRVSSALGTLRTSWSQAYEYLLGLSDPAAGVDERWRRRRRAAALLQRMVSVGFDPERYRSAVRAHAYAGKREGGLEVGLSDPANWLVEGEQMYLPELLRIIWEPTESPVS